MALTPEERARLISKIQEREAAPKLSNEQREGLINKIQENNMPIINEQHPKVGLLDRFAIKNLDATPEGAAKYLQKNNHGLQTKIVEGRLLLKDKDEKEWRTLDPSGFDVQDLSDAAGWIPEGFAQAGGTILGGTLGTPGGLPGIIAGGMGGAAVAGGAVNTAKQGIRQALGLQDEFDIGEVGQDALISGATAPFFGGFGKKAVQSLSKPIAKSIAEKGLIGTAYSHATRGAAPKIAELISGSNVPAKLFRYMTSRPDRIEKLAQAPNAPAESISKYLLKRAEDAKDIMGPEFEKISNSTAPVYIGDAADKLKSIINQKKAALSDAPGNTVLKNEIGKLEQVYSNVFQKEGPKVMVGGNYFQMPKQDIKTTTARTAYSLKKILGDIIEDSKGVDNSLHVSASAAKKDINASIKKSLGDDYKKLMDEYERITRHGENVQKVFSGNDAITQVKKTNAVMRNIGGPKQAEYTDQIKKLAGELEVKVGKTKTVLPGVDMEKAALEQQTFNLLHKPSYAPSFTGRSLGMSIPRMLAGAAGGSAWGLPGMAVGGALGFLGGSPGVMKQALRAGKGTENVIKKSTKKVKLNRAARGYINSLIRSEVNDER